MLGTIKIASYRPAWERQEYSQAAPSWGAGKEPQKEKKKRSYNFGDQVRVLGTRVSGPRFSKNKKK